MSKLVGTVVIVDGYSTGKYLAPAFVKHGYRCVHVQSEKDILPIFGNSFLPENFAQNYIFCGNIPKIINDLKPWQPQYVVAGTETGVELADLIAKHMNAPHNSSELSLARRNKFHMIEAVRQAGLRTVLHCRSNNVADILAWQAQSKLSPVVLKPEKSAGADHVYFCYTAEEIKSAFDKIIHTKTIFGKCNEHVLAQSFLEGTEYIVNTVSSFGIHHVAEIWRCHKEMIAGFGYISLLEELIPFESQLENEALANYAKSVLTALQIQHGPGHFEIMLTANGPVLIEVAARLQGCVDPAIVGTATKNNSSVSLMVESYLYPEKIKHLANHFYTIDHYVFRIFIKSMHNGILSKTPDLTPITQLSSFGSANLNCVAGDKITPTRDIASTLGVLHFIHSDLEQLKSDYEFYREYEANQLLQIA